MITEKIQKIVESLSSIFVCIIWIVVADINNAV